MVTHTSVRVWAAGNRPNFCLSFKLREKTPCHLINPDQESRFPLSLQCGLRVTVSSLRVTLPEKRSYYSLDILYLKCSNHVKSWNFSLKQYAKVPLSFLQELSLERVPLRQSLDLLLSVGPMYKHGTAQLFLPYPLSLFQQGVRVLRQWFCLGSSGEQQVYISEERALRTQATSCSPRLLSISALEIGCSWHFLGYLLRDWELPLCYCGLFSSLSE